MTGQYEDAETGLYHNRFRYYDTEAGQYASQDVKKGPYRSGNNAHVHKEDPLGNQLTDRGIASADKNETQIGICNPADLPQVRGRPHGS